MKEKTLYTKIFLLIVFSIGLCLFICKSSAEETEDNQIQELVDNLPQGWIATIVNQDMPYDACKKQPLFYIVFEYPSIVCETEIKAGVMNHSPNLHLTYYGRFSKQEREEYWACEERIKNSPTAVGAPKKFAETEEYTIMSYGGMSCPQKDTSEIMDYLREFYQ